MLYCDCPYCDISIYWYIVLVMSEVVLLIQVSMYCYVRYICSEHVQYNNIMSNILETPIISLYR